MLSVNRAGLNPVRMANGIDRKISPMGHRNACEQSKAMVGSMGVVGIIEPMHATLKLFKHLVPSYILRFGSPTLYLCVRQKGQGAVPQDGHIVVVAEGGGIQGRREAGG